MSAEKFSRSYGKQRENNEPGVRSTQWTLNILIELAQGKIFMDTRMRDSASGECPRVDWRTCEPRHYSLDFVEPLQVCKSSKLEIGI